MLPGTAFSRRSTLPTPLFAALSATLALASPLALATPATWIVDTCSEAVTTSGDHTGSLRYALNNAASGDTIDMTQIGAPVCSKISLLTGALSITQAKLFLNGPGADKLTIDAQFSYDRVITHTGIDDTLYISGLTLSNGYVVGSAASVYGGCIYSAGSVSLAHSIVYGCKATSTAGNTAAGGGIFARQGVSLDHVTMRNNIAEGPGGGPARGGAVADTALATFTMNYSTIADNQAGSSAVDKALGGGLFLLAGGSILNSTISGNTSNGNMGGLRIHGGTASKSVLIVNSTISGNSTMGEYSGGSIYAANAVISNTTIAFNHSNSIDTNNPLIAGFVVREPNLSSYTLNLQSTIASANTSGNVNLDFFFVGSTITAANNLVTAQYAAGSPLPGTIAGACALLAPLRDNGGPTRTHALQSTSPAIDQGNNNRNIPADQRTLFARVSGQQADMGAYEVDQDDIVFNSGLEGCP